MAGDKASKAGAVLGGAALVAAAIALAQKRVQAAPGDGLVKLDAETMQLLIALAQTTADIEQVVSQILGGLGGDDGPISLQVKGWPANTESIISTRVQIVAVNRAYQLPDINVPDGFTLQLKAWPTNLGVIWVGHSAATATNINQIWPLIASEAVGYAVKNANVIFISGTMAGEWLVLTVEQRVGG